MTMPISAFAADYQAPDVKIKSGTSSLKQIINNGIGWAIGLVGAMALLFIIYGGFLYITAAGNKERSENAKKTLTYAIGGLIIVILARIIVSLVDNTLGSFV